MKDYIKHMIPYFIAALVCCVIGAAANQERIRWPFSTGKVTFSLGEEDGTKVEFGLRNDGVVVWREIKPATTNSPAEEPEHFNAFPNEPWRWWTTNIMITNLVVPSYTNMILLNQGGTNGRDYPLHRLLPETTTIDTR